MAAGTVAEPDVGDLPVPVAVRGVALAAKPRDVVEPGGMDLGAGPRLAERLGEPGPAGVARARPARCGPREVLAAIDWAHNGVICVWPRGRLAGAWPARLALIWRARSVIARLAMLPGPSGSAWLR